MRRSLLALLAALMLAYSPAPQLVRAAQEDASSQSSTAESDEDESSEESAEEADEDSAEDSDEEKSSAEAQQAEDQEGDESEGDEAEGDESEADQGAADKPAEAKGGASDEAAAEASADEPAEKARSTKKVRLAHIVIEGALPESPGEMSLFGDLGVDLRKTIARIDKAADDKAIGGIVLVIETEIGRGKLNELRDCVKRTQSKGKKVFALLESAMGSQYQLAAACDEICIPESGEVLIPGIRAEISFYKDMLAKLGIEADMLHVGDYKGAAEPYTRDSLSEPVRKNMTALIDDLYDDMLSTIASDRDLRVEDVREAVDLGMIMADDAKERGLVDYVAYEDEFRDELADQYNTERLVFVMNYAKTKIDADLSGPMGMMKLFETAFSGSGSKDSESGSKIALIYCVGPIMSGESVTDIMGTSAMGSETIVEALRKANRNKDVKAIVMRVDSPGGSALASDMIWRQTQIIDKPIVVSMGDVAASGGYYISMGADRIFAEPGTITGSIGVVGGKMALKGLYDLIGMDTETISRGKNSGILSTTEKWSPSERKLIETMMKTIYGQFTAKAAEGRDMELDELEKLAGGQVFTGREAKRNGLIDEVGTLRDAVQAAKRLAGLDPDQKYELELLPEAKNPLEELFGASSDEEKEVRLAPFAGFLQVAPGLRGPLRHAVQLQTMLSEPVILTMPYCVEIK
ncbi:MAG TPA: signal peptide peptidase SppA [Lacipirellulaceae bacterium]|nr:signal peptide peptidase SppA [Lacipirellulaceae bacterium]